jgi:hypothetical protein
MMIGGGILYNKKYKRNKVWWRIWKYYILLGGERGGYNNLAAKKESYEK